jgi:hypothetical protein
MDIQITGAQPASGLLIATRYDPAPENDADHENATIFVLMIRGDDDDEAADRDLPDDTDSADEPCTTDDGKRYLDERVGYYPEHSHEPQDAAKGLTFEIRCELLGAFRVDRSSLSSGSPTLEYTRKAVNFDTRQPFNVYEPDLKGFALVAACLGGMLTRMIENGVAEEQRIKRCS